MKDGAPASQTRATTRLRSALVVVQIALSLVLLAGAGLLVRSFWKLQHVTLGFRPDGLLTLRLVLPEDRYASAASVIEFYNGLSTTLQRLPGIVQVSAANRLPISGGDGHGIVTIDGKAFAPGEAPGATYRRVLPNYFQAILDAAPAWPRIRCARPRPGPESRDHQRHDGAPLVARSESHRSTHQDRFG